jgi:hypothetical protein
MINDLHVDHINHFEQISNNFISYWKSLGKEVPTVFSESKDGSHRRCFLTENKDFENEWKEYHQNIAQLRFLCKDCNLTRDKFKVK